MKKFIFTLLLFLFVVEYSYTQNWISSSIIDGDDVIDVVDIVVDNNKDTYVFGRFKGTLIFDGTSYPSVDLSKYDIFLAKYDSDLQPLWFKSVGSDDNDIASNIIVNSNENIVITGSYRNTIKFTNNDSLISEGITDNFIAEYNSNGSLQSISNVGKGSNIQLLKSLDQDMNSRYILSGTFRDSIMVGSDTLVGRPTSYENFIVRLDAGFNLDTLIEIDNNNNRTVINSVKVSSDGYYFSGKYRDTIYLDIETVYNSSGVDDIFIYKTDFNFNGLFVRKASGDANDNTGTFTNDSYGNIYLAGNFQSSALTFDSTSLVQSAKPLLNKGGLDIYVAKYNKNGNLIWAKNYGGTSDDWARDIDLNNNVLYATGYYSDTIIFREDTLVSSGAGDRNAFIGTFDLNGNMLIATDITGSDGNDDSGTGIELYDNNALITGFFQSASITIGNDIYNNTTPGVKDLFIAEFEPPLISVFTNINGISCNSQTDGELIVTPYFGVAPYTYSWSHDGGLTDSTAIGLAPATYTVTVTDAVDSTAVISYDLTEPDVITFNPLITDVTQCSYSEEGAIDLSVAGGNGGYSYLWQASEGGYGVVLSAEDQSALTIGTYDVTVTDSKSCTNDTTIYITGPDPVTFGGSVVIDSSGIGPGAIDLYYTGGFGDPMSFTFDWQGPGGGITHSEDTTNLSPGNYSVTVTDVHLCEFDTIFNVANLDTFYIFISNQKDACFGTINGSATISYYSPEGHTGTDITYQWDANTGNQTTAQATNLASGRYYKVTVTDTQNSPNTVLVDSVYIDQLVYDFDGSLSGTTTLDCNGDTDGYIDLTITTPGELPYTYNWSTGSNLQDLTGLGIGSYSVTVTDDNECTFSITNYSIDQPSVLSAVAEIVNEPSCNGDFDGEITVDRSGGTAPYTYQWDDPGFQDTRNADGLDAAYYNVTVTDVNNCTATSGINLTEPGAINISKVINNEICNSAGEGAVTLTTTGGTTPFSYFWATTDGSGLVTTNKNQSGLTAGKYYFTATDDNNCTYEDSAEITEPPLLEITNEVKTDVNTCNGENTGTVTITATGGTGLLTYTLNPGAIQSNNTGVFTSIGAGNYTVNIEDENACVVNSSSLNITEPAVLTITEDDVNDATCNGTNNGSVDITVSGGTIASSYTFNWSTSNGSGIIAGAEDQPTLGAGTYNLTVTDDNLCSDNTSFVLTEPDTIMITKTVYEPACSDDNDGTITVTHTGGVLPFSYTWTTSNGSGLEPVNRNQGGLSPGTYYLEVTDALGCIVIDSAVVTAPSAIIIDSENSTDASGQDVADGTITVTASGGTGVLTYVLKPGNTSNQTGLFNTVLPGEYTVEVNDENYCGPIVSDTITVGAPNSIDLILADDFIKLYPNPTSSKVFVEIDFNGTFNLELMSISGQLIYQDKIVTEGLTKEEIDLSIYPKGIYIIKMYNSEYYLSNKIILQ